MRNKLFKRTLAILTTMLIAFVAVPPINASAAWCKDTKGNYYYKNSDGEFLKGFQTIGDNTYYFDKNGKMHTSKWVTTTSGNKYYFRKNGTMVTASKIKINGKVYNFDASGRLIVPSKLWKPFEYLEWGMTKEEVIKALDLKEGDYISDGNTLTIEKLLYADTYEFSESGLFGFTHMALNNSSETYEKLLISDGFEFFDDIEDELPGMGDGSIYVKGDDLAAFTTYTPEYIPKGYSSGVEVTTYTIFSLLY